MKRILLPVTILAVLLLIEPNSFSQELSNTDNLYYVVIGAFANPKNSDEFTANAKAKGLDGRSALNKVRKLYYVYILETPDRETAVTLVLKLQAESTYSDTWLYTGLLGDNPMVVKIEKAAVVDEVKTETVQTEVKPSEVKPAAAEPVKPVDGSKQFIFRLKSIDTGDAVSGDVDLFDADVIKGRKIVSYRGNDVVNVKPINKSGNIAVVCDIFGYRKIQMPINFNSPKNEDGVTVEDDGKVVVNFDLVRLKKGDKVIMYNVYFYNHAAIMRPESSYEVNALLEYLREKPTSRIKIHGHANGNDRGKIITMGTSKDFYTLSPENNESKGSATKLSEERARVIQSYLVSQGIDISRMELEAWGGKSPIYDEDHALAQANLRVEVEILEE